MLYPNVPRGRKFIIGNNRDKKYVKTERLADENSGYLFAVCYEDIAPHSEAGLAFDFEDDTEVTLI